MRRIILDFGRQTVLAEGMDLPQHSPIGLREAKAALCGLLSVETTVQVLELDFEGESIRCDGRAVPFPGLSSMETKIEMLVWHKETNMSNVTGLVDAVQKRRIDIQTFRHAMLLESMSSEPNSTVTAFLRKITGVD